MVDSLLYFFLNNDSNGILAGFYVASDYDKDEALYYVEIEKWIEFILFVANDSVDSATSVYCDKKKGLCFHQ